MLTWTNKDYMLIRTFSPVMARWCIRVRDRPIIMACTDLPFRDRNYKILRKL